MSSTPAFELYIDSFMQDMKKTFPEYAMLIDKTQALEKSQLFLFCQKKYTPCFADIVSKNEAIFSDESVVNTEFLPNIHFKNLWQLNITEQTRASIWYYLIHILSEVSLHKDLEKENLELEHAMEEIKEFLVAFSKKPVEEEDVDIKDAKQNVPEIFSGLMETKLGKIAQEIAENVVSQNEFQHATNMQDVFSSFLQNPEKLMGILKTTTQHLGDKMKSGELNESELMAEAKNIMSGSNSPFLNMPGMSDLMNTLLPMVQQMGLGEELQTGDTQKAQKKQKLETTKNRIRQKALMSHQRRMQEQLVAQLQTVTTTTAPALSDAELIELFEPTPKTKAKANADTNSKKKGKK